MLQSEIGLNSVNVDGEVVFGIREIFVALKLFKIAPLFLDSSITAKRSVPITSQHFWKKREVNPSGPRALSRERENTTLWTFPKVKGANKTLLSKLVIRGRIDCSNYSTLSFQE